ncbi:hypothetical protein VITFI_CDS1138 [Vitreoscilla filiformis]|uniref:Uncharacterized protein n=1 Tax=Vitreoscilla filiformis TaxID=63 RepID=A0A221KD17_VITFI|nr:hypothetical protein VITFI_CDS1138 [Vitreoscilla filiformis]
MFGRRQDSHFLDSLIIGFTGALLIPRGRTCADSGFGVHRVISWGWVPGLNRRKKTAGLGRRFVGGVRLRSAAHVCLSSRRSGREPKVSKKIGGVTHKLGTLSRSFDG